MRGHVIVRRFLLLVALLPVALGQGDLTALELAAELEPGGMPLAVSSEGRWIVANSFLGTLVWEMPEGRVAAIHEGHQADLGTPDAPQPYQHLPDAVAIREDGWLLSAAMSQGTLMDEGLIAWHVETGDRRVLAEGNCFAAELTGSGFVTACTHGVEVWRVSEEGLEPSASYTLLVDDIPVLPTHIALDEPRERLAARNTFQPGQGLHVWQLADAAELIATLETDGKPLGFTPEGELVTLEIISTENGFEGRLERWSADLAEVERYAPMQLRGEPSAQLSGDGRYVLTPMVGAEGQQKSGLELATGELLRSAADVRFSSSYGLLEHPHGLVWGGEQTTYPYPLLRLWQEGVVTDTVRHEGSYHFAFAQEDDWEVLRPAELRDMADIAREPLYGDDPESLVETLLNRWRKNEAPEGEALAPAEVTSDPLDGDDLAVRAEIALFDDSVRAERYEFALRPLDVYHGPEWVMFEARKQWQCARGEMAGEWTAELCP